MTEQQAPITLVVIDDDPDVLRATARILEQAHYHVITGGSAAQALELTRLHRPALLLLDVILPDGNGVDIARQLKNDSALTGVFVILMSGLKTSGEEQAAGLATGLADGYIARPFGKPEFLARIDSILRLRAAQEALRAALVRMQKIANRVPGVVYQYRLRPDGSSCFPYASEAIRDIYRVSPQQVMDDASPVFAVLHPADYDAVAASIQISARDLTPWRQEYRVKFEDGSMRWLFGDALPEREPDGGTLWHGFITDISERERSDQELGRLNRALRTLSACNEALVRAKDEAGLLDAICRLIVETGGYCMAWVGFPEQDAAKTVRVVAHYGDDTGYLSGVKVEWADSEHGRGPTGTAMRTGTVQLNQDSISNPMMAPWRESVLQRNYRASISLPLKSGDTTLGVLTIYAAKADTFNQVEVDLLQELAEDLGYGIVARRTLADRNRIALEQSRHAEILRQSLEESIKAIANTVEMRDPYTAGHQLRVALLAVAIAQEMGLTEETIHGIGLAASIHDLGKISVPSEILSKPTRLSAIEFMLLKTHAQAGFDILKDIKFPWPIATIVLQHHERMDGSGYPQGLQGDQILIESRIMAVADLVEAMASHRPYRAALGVEAALAEVERGRAVQFDPSVVDACLKLFRENGYTIES